MILDINAAISGSVGDISSDCGDAFDRPVSDGGIGHGERYSAFPRVVVSMARPHSKLGMGTSQALCMSDISLKAANAGFWRQTPL